MQKDQLSKIMGHRDIPGGPVAKTLLQYSCPWTEEPGGQQSMESQESDMTEHTHTHTDTGDLLHLLSWIIQE